MRYFILQAISSANRKEKVKATMENMVKRFIDAQFQALQKSYDLRLELLKDLGVEATEEKVEALNHHLLKGLKAAFDFGKDSVLKAFDEYTEPEEDPIVPERNRPIG